MNILLKSSVLCVSIVLAACNNDDHVESQNPPETSTASKYYQTKTPYQPQQDLKKYEAIPQGFQPVFTELVARHGSRGLSSIKYDLALYNLWKQAKAENALTSLGEKLGADLESMMKANILLGYGVDGIRQFGYGNESMQGIQEHRGIADRLLQRLPTLFQTAAQQSSSILVQSSGVDRAVDSAKFFTAELLQQQPQLKTHIIPVSYTSLASSSVPSIEDGGVDRFKLYFHSLNKEQDLVQPLSAQQQAIYDASQAYQHFEEDDADLVNKLNELVKNSRAEQVAMSVLNPLFKSEFIKKLGTTGYVFSNTGSYSVTSPKGETITEKGKGKNSIASAVDAAAYIYELYSISGGMKTELKGTDFDQYMPVDAAKFYAEFNDANDFYTKGPSFTESKNVTSAIAQGLKQDLFKQVDAIVDKQQTHRAVLRFAHAEIIIPLATSLELHNMMQSLPLRQTYSYNTSAWRGETVSPMAANLQWDIYQDKQGTTLLKMFYNEKETLFKPSCNYARYSNNSFYYDYLKLKQCYQIQ
ncbi:histidine-type phosphatase [Acinetobacter colistiniresistens]|uniref:histidine-type phosphatase n=1 Tax=Acinetobacter colistiniresistens TaxID=280145 RepID=UPI00211BFB14|nr:histidine-type phosphatase [Acinetobacter colistiniresistens]UUM26518.1 histidine-type phosphatase [Acinetobacter colistiniresistens]